MGCIAEYIGDFLGLATSDFHYNPMAFQSPLRLLVLTSGVLLREVFFYKDVTRVLRGFPSNFELSKQLWSTRSPFSRLSSCLHTPRPASNAICAFMSVAMASQKASRERASRPETPPCASALRLPRMTSRVSKPSLWTSARRTARSTANGCPRRRCAHTDGSPFVVDCQMPLTPGRRLRDT